MDNIIERDAAEAIRFLESKKFFQKGYLNKDDFYRELLAQASQAIRINDPILSHHSTGEPITVISFQSDWIGNGGNILAEIYFDILLQSKTLELSSIWLQYGETDSDLISVKNNICKPEFLDLPGWEREMSKQLNKKMAHLRPPRPRL